MFNRISKALEIPSLYTKSEAAFWNDEHISQQMLKAHLNPDFEGASRKLEFIEKSVAWIKETVSPVHYPSLLDVGCGPGIYAEKFSQAGYQVTGIDYSKRSVDYARQSAAKQNLDIIYLYQNYLEMQLTDTFDFSTMIYCDYGALSTSDRKTIMGNIYRHLKPGGRFLLDVFSMETYHAFQENQTWEICRRDGFWRKDPYIALNRCRKYSDTVTLEQISIISNTGVTVYYLWNTCFTVSALTAEAMDAGFKIRGVYSDVAGTIYHKDSLTIALLLEK